MSEAVSLALPPRLRKLFSARNIAVEPSLSFSFAAALVGSTNNAHATLVATTNAYRVRELAFVTRSKIVF